MGSPQHLSSAPICCTVTIAASGRQTDVLWFHARRAGPQHTLYQPSLPTAPGPAGPRAVTAPSSWGEPSLDRADLGLAVREGRRHLGTCPLDACSAVSFLLSQLLRIMHQHNTQGRGCPTGRAAGLQPAQGFPVPQETEGSSADLGARGRAQHSASAAPAEKHFYSVLTTEPCFSSTATDPPELQTASRKYKHPLE